MKPFNIHRSTSDVIDGYYNAVLASVNDHVIRISVMTEPYQWHHHPNSDEYFQVIEGTLALDLPDRTMVLNEGDAYTVAAGISHRTRPISGRSVNITCERANLTTIVDIHLE